MRTRTSLCLTLQVVLLGCLLPSVCQALLSDKKHGTWNLIGKIKAQATFRTIEAPDNNPIPIETGNLINQRTLLLMEFRHDLGRILRQPEIYYYLQLRAFYDSVWDIGPKIFRDDDKRRYYLFDNRDQINDLKWDVDLFLAFIDITYGPLFTRFGRQIISWGEMSTKRILDGTNPLDTTASLAVDLLERLVPLAMVRTTLTFDNVGPFSSVGVDGYYIPGSIENKNGEEIIDGSAVYPPIGRNTLEELQDPFSLSSLMQIVDQVPDDINSDRYGVKLNMMLGFLELNLAYYRVYSDIPVPFLDIDAFQPIYLTWPHIGRILGTLITDPSNFWNAFLGDQKLRVVLTYDTVDVYGGSFNYYVAPIDTVLRGEMGFLKDVPKIKPGSIADLVTELGGKVYLPGGNLTLADLLSGVDLGGLADMTLPFSSGSIATFDVLKYGIGIDKNVVTPLNRKKEFMLIFEYVGSKIFAYEENSIIYPWQGPNGETLYEPEYTHEFIFIARTDYFKGQLVPQFTTFYQVVPQALILIPGVTVFKGPWQFECTYMHTFSKSYEQEGFLATRNEITIAFSYNF